MPTPNLASLGGDLLPSESGSRPLGTSFQPCRVSAQPPIFRLSPAVPRSDVQARFSEAGKALCNPDSYDAWKRLIQFSKESSNSINTILALLYQPQLLGDVILMSKDTNLSRFRNRMTDLARQLNWETKSAPDLGRSHLQQQSSRSRPSTASQSGPIFEPGPATSTGHGSQFIASRNESLPKPSSKRTKHRRQKVPNKKPRLTLSTLEERWFCFSPDCKHKTEGFKRRGYLTNHVRTQHPSLVQEDCWESRMIVGKVAVDGRRSQGSPQEHPSSSTDSMASVSPRDPDSDKIINESDFPLVEPSPSYSAYSIDTTQHLRKFSSDATSSHGEPTPDRRELLAPPTPSHTAAVSAYYSPRLQASSHQSTPDMQAYSMRSPAPPNIPNISFSQYEVNDFSLTDNHYG